MKQTGSTPLSFMRDSPHRVLYDMILRNVIEKKSPSLTYTESNLPESPLEHTIQVKSGDIAGIRGLSGCISNFRLKQPDQRPDEVLTPYELAVLREGYGDSTNLDRIGTLANLRIVYAFYYRDLNAEVSLELPNGDVLEIGEVRLARFNPFIDKEPFVYNLFDSACEGTRMLEEKAENYAVEYPDKAWAVQPIVSEEVRIHDLFGPLGIGVMEIIDNHLIPQIMPDPITIEPKQSSLDYPE